METVDIVKFVRNAFEEKLEFIDGDGKQICFNLVAKLLLIL